MIKVPRTEKPSILHENADQWTADLLEQIQIKGHYKDVHHSYKNRYHQPEVQIALEAMYGGNCCYCEGNYGAGSYNHIEHLKPKAVEAFHHLAFEWENLHWSCGVCNTNKGDKWNDANPIIDPTQDEPSEHISFDVTNCEVVERTPRGKTTIDHVKLNRPRLVKARKRLRDRAIRHIQQLKSTPSQKDEQFYKAELTRMTDNSPENDDMAPYTMFINQVINDYL